MKVILKDDDFFLSSLYRKGLNQSDFANSLVVSKSSISNILNKKSVSPKMANKICQSLNAHFDDLFEIVESEREVK